MLSDYMAGMINKIADGTEDHDNWLGIINIILRNLIEDDQGMLIDMITREAQRQAEWNHSQPAREIAQILDRLGLKLVMKSRGAQGERKVG